MLIRLLYLNIPPLQDQSLSSETNKNTDKIIYEGQKEAMTISRINPLVPEL